MLTWPNTLRPFFRLQVSKNEKTNEKKTVLNFYGPKDGIVVCAVTDNAVDLAFASDVAQMVRFALVKWIRQTV